MQNQLVNSTTRPQGVLTRQIDHIKDAQAQHFYTNVTMQNNMQTVTNQPNFQIASSSVIRNQNIPSLPNYQQQSTSIQQQFQPTQVIRTMQTKQYQHPLNSQQNVYIPQEELVQNQKLLSSHIREVQSYDAFDKPFVNAQSISVPLHNIQAQIPVQQITYQKTENQNIICHQCGRSDLMVQQMSALEKQNVELQQENTALKFQFEQLCSELGMWKVLTGKMERELINVQSNEKLALLELHMKDHEIKKLTDAHAQKERELQQNNRKFEEAISNLYSSNQAYHQQVQNDLYSKSVDVQQQQFQQQSNQDTIQGGLLVAQELQMIVDGLHMQLYEAQSEKQTHEKRARELEQVVASLQVQLDEQQQLNKIQKNGETLKDSKHQLVKRPLNESQFSQQSNANASNSSPNRLAKRMPFK